MASLTTNAPLEESWVISQLEESTHSEPVIIEEPDSAPISFPSANISPVSSFSEGDLIKEYEDEQPAASLESIDRPDPTGSIATVSSSISSGPELIMPSILFESRASGTLDRGSWVVPRKRNIQSLYESRKAPRRSKCRNQASGPTRHSRQAQMEKTGVSADRTRTPETSFQNYYLRVKHFFSEDVNRYQFFRSILNALLLLTAMHLLIFPEIVHQLPILCKVPGVSWTYSQTCAKFSVPSFQTSTYVHPGLSSLLSTRDQLHRFLNETISDMASVDTAIKETDSILRRVRTDLEKNYRTAHYESELEFDGAWTASRLLTRALIDLRTDMKSAVNALQRPVRRQKSFKETTSTNDENTQSLVSRLKRRALFQSENKKVESNGFTANQYARVQEELDNIIDRLARESDAVLVQLDKLDDHLQSLHQLVIREEQQAKTCHSKTNQTLHMWTSLVKNVLGDRVSPSEKTKQDNQILIHLEQISLPHKMLAQVVGRLAGELKQLQRIQFIRA